MTATDITAPIGEIVLGETAYPLRFDNEQIRQTELAWQALAGHAMGYLGILYQAERGVFAAQQALGYGAIASGEADAGIPKRKRLTLLRFDRMADYATITAQAQALLSGATQALPEAKGKEKNA